MTAVQDDEPKKLEAMLIGPVRMVVNTIGPSPGSRQKLQAYCKMLDPAEPYVSVMVTVIVPEGYRLAHHEGDEFLLTFGPPE